MKQVTLALEKSPSLRAAVEWAKQLGRYKDNAPILINITQTHQSGQPKVNMDDGGGQPASSDVLGLVASIP